MAKIRPKNHFRVNRNSVGWTAKHEESSLEFTGPTSQKVYYDAEKWLSKNQGGIIAVKDEFGRHKFSKTIQPAVEPKNLFN